LLTLQRLYNRGLPLADSVAGMDSKTNKQTAPRGAVFFGDWRRAGKMDELSGAQT
jgi:hypothetical protein